MQLITVKIIASQEITSWAHLLWLEAPEITAAARPGQFVMVGCGPDTTLRRPFSLHRVDRENGRIAVLFNIVGQGTQWLAAQEEGTVLDVLGPLGNGFTLPGKGVKTLVIGGGIGIAPLEFVNTLSAA